MEIFDPRSTRNVRLYEVETDGFEMVIGKAAGFLTFFERSLLEMK